MAFASKNEITVRIYTADQTRPMRSELVDTLRILEVAKLFVALFRGFGCYAERSRD